MEKQKCPSCKKEFLENVSICTNCNFPFDGTDKEKAIHIGRFISSKGIITDSNGSIEKSQKILYTITGINIFFMIIGFSNGNFVLVDIIINSFITLIFLLCGIFLKKKPLLLTVIPLTMMIGIYTLNYLIEPNSIFSGILMKIFILCSLIYSIYLILSAEKFKKDFQINE